MSKKLENLRDTLCGELEKVAKKEEISMSDLDVIDKLTHSIKNLDKVMLGNEMIEQYGYEFPDYSGARRGRDGDSDGRYNESSNRRGRGRGRSRDSYDGNYESSYDRSYDGSYNDGRSYERDYSRERGYSGHEHSDIDRFKHMMQDAVNQL
jgi:hypothetical protein